MKKLLLALALTIISINAQAKQPKDIKALIAKEESLNEQCRGGSGDDPATMKACDERDKVINQINAKGWCWGHGDQIEANRKWEKCRK